MALQASKCRASVDGPEMVQAWEGPRLRESPGIRMLQSARGVRGLYSGSLQIASRLLALGMQAETVGMVNHRLWYAMFFVRVSACVVLLRREYGRNLSVAL